MDIFTLLKYLTVVASCLLVTESSGQNSDWLKTSLQATKQERKAAKPNKKDDTDSSISTTEKKIDRGSCCQNDGICILNSFCHCKKQFYGRYCQHRQKQRSCGTISHGTWMAAGCVLCHCFDGNLTCKESAIPGCESMPYTEEKEIEPHYDVSVDKKFEDYDKFYDDEYESETTSSAPPSCNGFPTHVMVISLLFAVWKRMS